MPNVLTHKFIDDLKPTGKRYRKHDGDGLYVEVSEGGAKYLRFKFKFARRHKTLALGVFPNISLKQARQRRDDAKRLLSDGIDPAARRAAAKRVGQVDSQGTLEAVAREWFSEASRAWVEAHASKVMGRLERYVFPTIGGKRISDVTPMQILELLKKIQSAGHRETAHRVRVVISQVYGHAIATGRAAIDPSFGLSRQLLTPKHQSMATILVPKKIGALLRDIDGYTGSEVTRAALKLGPLLFVRPGELRHAEWKDIDFEEATWSIPAERMKMRTPHLVPLALQSIAVLKHLHDLTGHGRYVFPGVRSSKRPMSPNTVNAALRYMGYAKDEITGHGFRAMASTLLNESRLFLPDAIERQLAHSERNTVRAAYNWAQYLDQRRIMMAYWADQLDSLRLRGN